MHVVEAVDVTSKLLALTSVILHMLGYMDTGTFVAALSALAAVMASLMLHRYRHRVGNALRGIGKPRLFLVKTLRGEAIPIQGGCRICGRPDRDEIERMIRESGLGEALLRLDDVTAEDLKKHLEHAKYVDPETLRRRYRVREIDLREEMFKLLERLDDLYTKLDEMDRRFQEGRVNPRVYIDSIGERRQLLSKIRETIVTITKLKAELRTTQQLSELLQRLKEP